jgi:Fe-S cluster assembly iron-binding protein IscA
VVTIDPKACAAITETLSGKGLPFCLRIEIRSTGCCDASLGMMPDTVEPTDRITKIGILTFIMRPALHDLVGAVSISCAEDGGKDEFIIVSEKPLNEWAGFGRCPVRL